MKDKFCVSKTLTYLVLLVAVVAGAFYVMNVANTQKLGANPQAGASCKGGLYASVKNYPGGCNDLAAKFKTPFHEDTDGQQFDKDNNLVSRCCIGDKVGVTVGTATAASCKSVKGNIAKMYGYRCTYYTGTVSKNGDCQVAQSDDFIACQPGVDKPLADKNSALKDACANANIKDKYVAGQEGVMASNGNWTCMVYTGAYRKGGNPTDPSNLTNFCMTKYLIDYNTGTRSNPEYKTDNCLKG